jgi:hypothetical protein
VAVAGRTRYGTLAGGRLAVVICENDNSGLRRTYTDRHGRRLEAMLPQLLSGLAEHAALKQTRRLKAGAAERLAAIANAKRRLTSEFEAREARRLAFIAAIEAQLAERARLQRVLAEFEMACAPEAVTTPDLVHGAAGDAPPAMMAWIRWRLSATEALLSPRFLQLSARAANVTFEEPRAASDDAATRQAFSNRHAPCLQFWSRDDPHLPLTPYDWAIETGSLFNIEAGAND